jgi:hypothetical protein
MPMSPMDKPSSSLLSSNFFSLSLKKVSIDFCLYTGLEDSFLAVGVFLVFSPDSLALALLVSILIRLFFELSSLSEPSSFTTSLVLLLLL